MSVFFSLQISLFFFENQFLEKPVFKTSFFNHPNTLVEPCGNTRTKSVFAPDSREQNLAAWVLLSPDGREVMCGCDKTVRVWSICTGEDGTIDELRLKRVIGVAPTVPRALGCRNADAVEPELARRILCDIEE